MSIISNCTATALADAATRLIRGNLVAFPTETVYGLGVDANNKAAVARLYAVKGRPTTHPLIVHISSIVQLDKWARDIPEYAIQLGRSFWPGPMTLILPRKDLAKDFITGGQENVGVRVPAHSVALELLKKFESQGGLGVAAPSANRFGKVSPTTANAVENELGQYLTIEDQILNGGQSFIGLESTIIDCTQTIPAILRPGGVSFEMINDLLLIDIKQVNVVNNNIKAPGILDSHYAPKAKVYLTGKPSPGDGFIALESVPTPKDVIRLANPSDNNEYAQVLYGALRLADLMGLDKIFVVTPSNEGLGIAINDRLIKASSKFHSMSPKRT